MLSIQPQFSFNNFARLRFDKEGAESTSDRDRGSIEGAFIPKRVETIQEWFRVENPVNNPRYDVHYIDVKRTWNRKRIKQGGVELVLKEGFPSESGVKTLFYEVDSRKEQLTVNGKSVYVLYATTLGPFRIVSMDVNDSEMFAPVNHYFSQHVPEKAIELESIKNSG